MRRARHRRPQESNAVVVFVLALVAFNAVSVADAQASILVGETTPTFKFSTQPSQPTDMTITLGVELAAGDRVHCYLPLFRGASNSFGAHSSAVINATGAGVYETPQPSPPDPARSGIRALDVNGDEITAGLASAFWDALTETLRVVVRDPAIVSLHIDSRSLRVTDATNAAANGLGPLPPTSGMQQQWWYRTASISAYSEGECQINSVPERPGLPPEECEWTTFGAARRQVTFDAAASSKLSSASPRLFAQPDIGQVGIFDYPQFAFSSVGGGLSGTEVRSCVTVTLISSVTMTSLPDYLTQITIGGLVTSATADEEVELYLDANLCAARSTATGIIDILQSASDTPQLRKGTYRAAAQELVVQLQVGTFLQAYQVLVFSFALRNPAVITGPTGAPTVAATGRYCLDSPFCSSLLSSYALGILPEPFQTARKVLETDRNHFSVKDIVQGSTQPFAVTSIFVTLAANQHIRDSTIEISGLCAPLENLPPDADPTEGIELLSNRDNLGQRFAGAFPTDAITDADNIIRRRPMWSQASRTLQLSAGPVGMQAGTRYAFVVRYVTPSPVMEVDGCTPTISVRGTTAVTFTEEDMAASNVGRVEARGFSSLQVGQVSTQPGIENYICVTLVPNVDIASTVAAQTSITVTGLEARQGETARFLPLVGCPRQLSRGQVERPVPLRTNTPFESDRIYYNPADGTMEINVAAGQTLIRSGEVQFAFGMLNPIPPLGTTLPCQNLTMQMSGGVNMAMTQLTTPATQRAMEGGASNGDACPFKVYSPKFTTKNIGQSIHRPGVENTLSVTLRSNMDLAAVGSQLPEITISGLLGSETPDTATFQNGIVGVVNKPFFRVQSAQWTRATGSLVMRLAGSPDGSCNTPDGANYQTGDYCIKAGVDYCFTFALRNPGSPQDSNDVTIAAQTTTQLSSIQTLVSFVPEEMVSPSVLNRQPLRVVGSVGDNDLIDKASVKQHNPNPSAMNAVCVSFILWRTAFAQPGVQTASIRIAGLTGFETEATTLPMYGRDGLTELGQALLGKFNRDELVWNRAAGTLSGALLVDTELTAGVNHTFCVHLRNPSESRPCLQPSITVSSPGFVDTVTLAREESLSPGAGHPVGAACAGFVVPKGFQLASARQATNVTGMLSLITVEMATNFPITGGKITIAGLHGFARTLGDGPGPVEVTSIVNGILTAGFFQEFGQFDGAGQMVLEFQTGGSMQPSVLFPSQSARPTDVVVVQFEMVNGWETHDGSHVHIITMETDRFTMVPTVAQIGPLNTQADQVVVPPNYNFNLADYKTFAHKSEPLALRFSQNHDSAGIEFPEDFDFPRWFSLQGDQLSVDEFMAAGADARVATTVNGTNITRRQVISHVTTIQLPPNNSDSDGVDIPLFSSFTRSFTEDDHPLEENSGIARRAVAVAPKLPLVECPDGFDVRLVNLVPSDPSVAVDPCFCASACGAARPNCSVRESGQYAAVLLREDECFEVVDLTSNAGLILGIVTAAAVTILAAIFGYVYLKWPEIFEKEEDSSTDDNRTTLAVPKDPDSDFVIAATAGDTPTKLSDAGMPRGITGGADLPDALRMQQMNNGQGSDQEYLEVPQSLLVPPTATHHRGMYLQGLHGSPRTAFEQRDTSVWPVSIPQKVPGDVFAGVSVASDSSNHVPAPHTLTRSNLGAVEPESITGSELPPYGGGAFGGNGDLRTPVSREGGQPAVMATGLNATKVAVDRRKELEAEYSVSAWPGNDYYHSREASSNSDSQGNTRKDRDGTLPVSGAAEAGLQLDALPPAPHIDVQSLPPAPQQTVTVPPPRSFPPAPTIPPPRAVHDAVIDGQIGEA